MKSELVSIRHKVTQHVFARSEDRVFRDLIVSLHENLCYERLVVGKRGDDMDMRRPVGPSLATRNSSPTGPSVGTGYAVGISATNS